MKRQIGEITMKNQELSVRSFQEGDEEFQAIIYNKVMREIDPQIPEITPEEMKKHYEEDPEFVPEGLKILVNSKNQVVGYAKCSSRLGSYSLQFPLILEEYRSEKTLSTLLEFMYLFARNKVPKSIRSTYLKKYEQIHDFFRNQKVININNIVVTQRLKLSVDKLNFELPGYKFEAFTPKDFDKLLSFRYSRESIIGRELSPEILKRYLKNKNYSSSFIYQKGDLLGWGCVRINYPPNDYDKSLRYPIGVLSDFCYDSSHNDLLSLRKALFKSGFTFLHNNKISEFRVWTNDSSSIFEQRDKYGFELTGESELIYEFET